MGNRFLVAVLAAVDAVVTAVAGVAAVLAPLTVLWVFGFGDRAVWGALWPAAARIWELGHLVPLSVALPVEYTVAVGVPSDAAAFTVSLAPLALAGFTAIAGARSGTRAAVAGTPATGVVAGSAVFAALAGAVAVTSANPVASVALWQAVLLPALVFGVPAAVAALARSWAGEGRMGALRRRLPPHWRAVPGLAVRGAAIVGAGLVAVGALVVTWLLALRGDQVIALFEAARVDALGATVVTLGQLGYLPTLIVWAVAVVAGPGVALGAGTTIAPAVAPSGVIPGIPVLGMVPQASSPWLLLLALVPVALGAAAAMRVRRGLGRPALPRLVAAAGIAVLVAGAAWVVATAASGALGPGALGRVGPNATAVAIALGAEVLVGAAIVLLAPMRRDDLPVPATTSARELVGAAGPYQGRL